MWEIPLLPCSPGCETPLRQSSRCQETVRQDATHEPDFTSPNKHLLATSSRSTPPSARPSPTSGTIDRGCSKSPAWPTSPGPPTVCPTSHLQTIRWSPPRPRSGSGKTPGQREWTGSRSATTDPPAECRWSQTKESFPAPTRAGRSWCKAPVGAACRCM